MDYSEFASILDACSNPETFHSYLQIHYPNSSVLISKSFYFFIQISREVLILIPGDVKSENRELILKNTPKSSFKLYKDYLKLRESHQSLDFIGVGYSNGANLILALSDIVKLSKTICFNPIGPGKKLLDSDFYVIHKLTPEEPELQIYRVKSSSLSKSFSWTCNSIKEISGNADMSPHSLKNFSKIPSVKIEGITKEFTSIKGITFNPNSGFLLLELENDLNNYFIEAALATVFYVVYSKPTQFSFTLVPADKLNTSGPYQSKVYYPPELEGTIIGHYLWEADWKLKQMDLGMWYDDLTGQMIPITLDISWFKSGFDFYLEESHGKSVARLWFVMEKVEFEYANNHDGICIRPKDVKVKVQARKLAYNESCEHGLEDSEGYHPSFKFAEYVNQHIEELAEIVPEIKKLKEISLLVSIAQFFRDDLKIPSEMINLPSLREKILKVPDFYEKNKVPRLSRKSERVSGNEVNVLNLFGGVSMISQETKKRFESSLIKYIKRTDKVLAPFYWNHYDYMHNLLEYQETADEEDLTTFTVFSLCPQIECSDPQCNNLVVVNCQKLETDLEVDIEELSPYSYEGKIYCQQHHPYRCSRKKCQQLICPGESYAELETGKFHASCVICEHCLKAITLAYVYSNGFWHEDCLGKGPAPCQDEWSLGGLVGEELKEGEKGGNDVKEDFNDFSNQKKVENNSHLIVSEKNKNIEEEKKMKNEEIEKGKNTQEERKTKIGKTSMPKGTSSTKTGNSTLKDKDDRKKPESSKVGNSQKNPKAGNNQTIRNDTDKGKNITASSSNPTKVATKTGSSSKK